MTDTRKVDAKSKSRTASSEKNAQTVKKLKTPAAVTKTAVQRTAAVSKTAAQKKPASKTTAAKNAPALVKAPAAVNAQPAKGLAAKAAVVKANTRVNTAQTERQPAAIPEAPFSADLIAAARQAAAADEAKLQDIKAQSVLAPGIASPLGADTSGAASPLIDPAVIKLIEYAKEKKVLSFEELSDYLPDYISNTEKNRARACPAGIQQRADYR